MLQNHAALIFGIVCAGIGGEVFVRGAVGLARWSRISPGIIGATVAAFATSSPELSVSISSAVVGKPQIALAEEVLGAQRAGVAVIYCVIGLLLLLGAGYFIVSGARGIALQLGIGEFVIGATVVAVGTSVPELATAIIAKLRGHDEVGLGTILGSNIFNGLFIVGVAATIHPIAVGWQDVFIALTFGTVALVCSYPASSGFIERRRGVLLLVLYAAYLTTVLQAAS